MRGIYRFKAIRSFIEIQTKLRQKLPQKIKEKSDHINLRNSLYNITTKLHESNK